jgi:AraC-like DNA-binding protein
VNIASGTPLDLMAAWIGRRHYAPHTHDEYAIGVCVGGVEAIRYRGERLLTGPGSVVVLEPGEAHTGGPAADGGFGYRVFYPTGALLSAFSPSCEPPSVGAAGPTRFREPLLQDAELARELRLVHLLLSGDHDPLEGETRLLGLLATLVHRHSVTGAHAPRGVRSPGPVARTVMTRLADQMTGPPALGEIADDLGLSRYQVLRAFRDELGMPPYAWLAQHRVARARALLEDGLRPAEVAALVGFADQAHLTRWFRRVLGITPGAFRNSVQDSPLRRTRGSPSVPGGAGHPVHRPRTPTGVPGH